MIAQASELETNSDLKQKPGLIDTKRIAQIGLKRIIALPATGAGCFKFEAAPQRLRIRQDAPGYAHSIPISLKQCNLNTGTVPAGYQRYPGTGDPGTSLQTSLAVK
eukprot:463527-Rhodomonas_salina.1